MSANMARITIKDGVILLQPTNYTIKLRRGTRAQMEVVIFVKDEFVYMTDTKEYYHGDGATPGGVFFAKE